MQKIFIGLFLIIAGLGVNAQNVVRDANAQVRNVVTLIK